MVGIHVLCRAENKLDPVQRKLTGKGGNGIPHKNTDRRDDDRERKEREQAEEERKENVFPHWKKKRTQNKIGPKRWKWKQPSKHQKMER